MRKPAIGEGDWMRRHVCAWNVGHDLFCPIALQSDERKSPVEGDDLPGTFEFDIETYIAPQLSIQCDLAKAMLMRGLSRRLSIYRK